MHEPAAAESQGNGEIEAPRSPRQRKPLNLSLFPMIKRSHLHDDVRRDSGLAPSPRTTRTESLTETGDGSIGGDEAPEHESGATEKSKPSTFEKETLTLSEIHPALRESHVPRIVAPVENETVQGNHERFRGITTVIPSGSFEDLVAPAKLEFSPRGSMLFKGHKPNAASRAGSQRLATIDDNAQRQAGEPGGRSSVLRICADTPEPSANCGPHGSRVLSDEEATLSKVVRSKYEHGDELGKERNNEFHEDDPGVGSRLKVSLPPQPQKRATLQVRRTRSRLNDSSTTADADIDPNRASLITRERFETAGGIEDWQDVHSGDVDRYGFIAPRSPKSQNSSPDMRISSEPGLRPPATTELQWASPEPRRKGPFGRLVSSRNSSRSMPGPRASSQQSMQPSISSVLSRTSISSGHQRLRHAANRLPYNRDRRWLDEAGDMLTLPPGLADVAEQEEGGKAALAMKKREWSRQEKWRSMARVTARNGSGGGMSFEFDTKDEKLISRTWKGIPDRWRAPAWHAFLSASARRHKVGPSDEELVARFNALQEESSADDPQIDVDVPRTINRHIMFRRRYRGGQRLLFRVLHAHSLYFPDPGYVQGMAALAATLLCYYDEERAFVMLVRMWQLRGLERLYQSGFGGLMDVLREFEVNWLAGSEVGRKLEELSIPPTAYGTRWYLTLFNYSIPFAAQLRVWDVFMLLGDASADHDPAPFSSSSSSAATANRANLDVLHATAAALIDATRDIVLLDADFESAMKVLTAWIAVRDEDLLMKVTRAEWKTRRKRAGVGAAGAAGGGGGKS